MAKKTPTTDKQSLSMFQEFKPRTKNQTNYIRTMAENRITVCIGPPGTGKSFCSVGLACNYLVEGRVDYLMFSRPLVGCGKGIAALPGNVWEKSEPYFFPVIDCLEYFLGKEQYRSLYSKGIIQFKPLELMRGMSIKDTFLVLDEASNADISQLKMLLSRLDDGSKFVLEGDYNQCDLKHCDFKDIVEKLKSRDINGFGYCELDESDIQRPKLIAEMMKAIEN